MNRIRFSLAKIVTVALCIALLPCWGAFAATPQPSGDYFYVIQDDGTAKITDYTGDASSLTVPEALDGYAVTAIGDYAFVDCKTLTEITLPEGVTTIGEEAFGYCLNLTEITLPDSVKAIGDLAFRNCKLTEVTLPDSLTAIGDYAFGWCGRLTEITLPNSLESIGANPFTESGVQIIHVRPDHPFLSTSGGGLFSKPDKRLICYPSARTDSAFAVPEGILVIGDGAFSHCENLTEVTLPDGLTTIGYEAFAWCGNLTEITLPDSVTAIGDDAFYDCENLSAIIVGQDSYAMEYCVANNLPYSVRTK